MSLEKYKDYLLARKKSLAYYNYMKLFLDYIEKNKISIITQEVITEFLKAGKINGGEYAENTIGSFIRSGRDYYTNFLGIEKDKNEFYKIKPPKCPRKKPEFLTEEELNKALKYLINDYRTFDRLKLTVIVKFMFYTGLRKSEILGLERKNFELDKCSVKVYQKKAKRDKISFYPPELRDKIRDYFKIEKEELNAFNIKESQIEYIAKKISSYFPEKNITPHTLRHSFAKHLLKKGHDLAKVSKLMGHSNIMTTMIYLDPTEDELREWYLESIKGDNDKNENI